MGFFSGIVDSIGGMFDDPLVMLDPGGLVYQSNDPDALAWQAGFDVGGIGAAPALASQQAAGAQQSASQRAISEQRRQFDTVMNSMYPYTQAGASALGQQQGLLGLSGNTAQQSAINNLMKLPQFQSMIDRGENSILQNASASGNLRGGNTQASLAQYRPQAFSSLANQQLANFGGLSSLGQASAVGQGAYGQNTASNIGNIMQQQAASQAGGMLAQGNQQAQTINTLAPVIASFF